jgi:hypothetical protein
MAQHLEPIETADGGLLFPDGRLIKPRVNVDENGITRVGTLMTGSEWWTLQKILRSQYFLFRNEGGDYGERLICRKQNPDGTWRGCGLKHMYITYMCVEMPFRGGDGLEEGLFLTFRAATDQIRKHQILTAISKLPDLAMGHPMSARDFQPDDPGENWLSVLLSVPEPITRERAEHFAAKINDRRPPIPFDLGPP